MRSAHLAVGTVAAILTVVIVGYAFTENYVVAPRPAAGRVTLPVMVTDGKSEWQSDVRVYVPQDVS